MPMLNHYVPRYYLKGFVAEDSDDQVWTFDKEQQQFFRAGVGKVAAVHGFYEDEVEKQLNESVEMPGNNVIEAIRRRQTIAPADKARLAFYIAVLMMRVPEKRRRGFEMLPEVVDETIEEATRQIKALAEEAEVSGDIVRKRLTEVEEARRMFKTQPPQGLIESIHDPWPTENVVDAVISMRWRFGVAPGLLYFLTSDNPVFYFRCYGVGTEDSELTFPISSDIVLFGDRRGTQVKAPPYLELPMSYVKEVNRRVASEATRFVFSKDNPGWIPAVVNKRNPYLSRIMWGDA